MHERRREIGGRWERPAPASAPMVFAWWSVAAIAIAAIGKVVWQVVSGTG